MDLSDLEHNTRDGLHIASLAGAWIAAVAGFGGMRDHDGMLGFAPQLPERLTRLCFRLGFRGSRLRIEVLDTETSYSLLDGPPLEIRHFGDPVTVGRQTRTFPARRIAPTGTVTQPSGRAPSRRRPASD
jgi:alpha,alpha-trehalose phosphorylase